MSEAAPKGEPNDEASALTTAEKRAKARARARKFQSNLKRKNEEETARSSSSAGGAGGAGDAASAGGAPPQPTKKARIDTAENRRKSRARAARYSERFFNRAGAGVGVSGDEGAVEGYDDEEESEKEMDTGPGSSFDEDGKNSTGTGEGEGKGKGVSAPVKPLPIPAGHPSDRAIPSNTAYQSPARSHSGALGRLEQPPPMPTIRPPDRLLGGRTDQIPLRGDSPPSPSRSQDLKWGGNQMIHHGTGQVTSRRHGFPLSFLRFANAIPTGADGVNPVALAVDSNGAQQPGSEASSEAVGSSHEGHPERKSFLDRVRPPTEEQEGHADSTSTSTAAAGAIAKTSTENVNGDGDGDGDVDVEVDVDVGFEEGRGQRRLNVWDLTCTMALAPVIFLCILSSVLLVWPQVMLAAGGARGVFRGLAYRSSSGSSSSSWRKCFLLPSEHDASVCKEGAERMDCPRNAVCGAGRILTCDFPFVMTEDRSGCVLTSEVEKEALAVVEALRTLTIEQHCKGNGLIMPRASGSRSFITLADAAIAQDREPLSFLAGMKAGDVGGLVILEGEAATEFGGGGNGADLVKGTGYKRIARLPDGAYDAVMLTLGWRCRLRLAAGSWVMEHWMFCGCMYALIFLVVCLDLRRHAIYEKRKKVCAIRDDCYRAVLGHAASDSTPLQVSHIQSDVGVRRRARMGGQSLARVHQEVRMLWPLVEKEVNYDTRIRKNFRDVRGQHSVPCWQWIGSAGTTFEDIGRLSPGPAPRFWLLRWLNQPVPTT